jgi:hypothetical protein
LRNGFKIIIKYFTLFLCAGSAGTNAQILQDTATLNLIRKGSDSIYNMQFSYPEEVYKKIDKLYPEHPVVILFKGILTYWEYYPLLSESSARKTFEEELLKCIDLCKKNKKQSYESEYLLANLGARGLLLTFYADNDLRTEVFPLAKSTYRYIRRSFDFTSFYPDFFLFTGLYNYYREVYPRVHPVYKPLAFLFPDGNREKGLADIKKAANSAILVKAESFSYLSYIYINYEDDFQQALYFSKHLHELFPQNPEFLADYIQNLLLMKDYDEAENLIISSAANVTNSFYQAQLSVFEGIIREKKYYDNKLAMQYYLKCINDIKVFGSYGNETAAYAYFGLSRISEAYGDKDRKKNYHKQATKLAGSKKITFD